MKTTKSLWIMMLFLALASGIWGAPPAEAAAPNRLVAIPGMNKTEFLVGETIPIRIEARDVTDLFGVQFVIRYDPAKLQLAHKTTDGQITDWIVHDSSFNLMGGQKVDKTQGIIAAPLTKQEISPAFVSIMPISEIRFQAVQSGSTTIRLEKIKIVDSTPREIQSSVEYQAGLQLRDASAVQTAVSLEWDGAVSAGGSASLSHVEVIAQSGDGATVRKTYTDAEGKAVFTGLTGGRWTFRTFAPGISDFVPTVIQTGVCFVDVTASPGSTATLKVAPVKHPAASSGEPVDIRDVVQLVNGVTDRSWDFDQDGASSRNDALYVLRLIGYKTGSGE